MERQSGIYYFFEKIILSQNIKLFLLKTNFLFAKAMILLKKYTTFGMDVGMQKQKY